MPKVKTAQRSEEEVQGDGDGEALRRQAMKSHNLEKKSPKRKRRFGKDSRVAQGDAPRVKKLLGMR